MLDTVLKQVSSSDISERDEIQEKMAQEEIRKGPWTEQEDFKLVCFVGLFGDRRWDFIAKVSGLKVAGDK